MLTDTLTILACLKHEPERERITASPHLPHFGCQPA
jgi:hypothetical protein